MRKAFTLIEILMVIATILILAAILFPVVARAKEGGKLTVAMSQAKELGRALALYTEDHDEKLPPSTNYAVPVTAKNRLWPNLLLTYAGKAEKLFVAAGTEGKFAKTWEERGEMTLGLNSALAFDPKKGCPDDLKDTTNCLAFRSVLDLGELEDDAKIALIASTPGGPSDKDYRGYEFSPYNRATSGDPDEATPLVADRDLVKALSPLLPADLIKPIYARYFSDLSNNGRTPVIFADGHAKNYSAREILGRKDGTIWRIR